MTYLEKRIAEIKDKFEKGREYCKQYNGHLAGMADEPQMPDGCSFDDPDF